MKRTISRGVSAAAVALLAVATACTDARDPLSPKIEAWGTPPPQSGELKGTGTIENPEGGLLFFDFDVRHDATGTHGSFTGVALATGETLTATSFTSFTFGSGFCATASNGDEFEATGALAFPGGSPTPVTFTIQACDNGPAVLGGDTFHVVISNGFDAQGTVVGDIQKS